MGCWRLLVASMVLVRSLLDAGRPGYRPFNRHRGTILGVGGVAPLLPPLLDNPGPACSGGDVWRIDYIVIGGIIAVVALIVELVRGWFF